MWSEELDKKIKLAAEGKDPAYNDKSWDKMESLLDKHLPREKKRRRILFLLFIFLLTGSTVFFLLQKSKTPGKNNLTNTGTQVQSETGTQERPKPPDAFSSHVPDLTAEDPKPTASIEKVNSKTPAPSTKAPVNARETKSWPTARQDIPAADFLPGASTARKTRQSIHAIRGRDKEKETVVIPRNPAMAPFGQPGTVPGNDQPENDIAITGKDAAPAQDTVVSRPDDSTGTKESIQKKPQKESATNKNRLAFLVSAGPDISSVGLHNPGTLKMQGGIGASYDINSKWSVRTGFYVSRKIYTADSADYHPPKGYWNYYSSVGQIDANCMVYEIPLNVIYNFPPAGRHNWFASAGLSSYLMKKETYNYWYKNMWGQSMYAERTYDDNDHFFSIAHLSGGYRYRFSDRFSLMAEPYIKLPLSGVGFGKVKLNSGGIIFTGSFKPFAGKK